MKKTSKRLYFLFIVVYFLLFSCNQQPKWDANAFFEQTFNIIKDASIKKYEIDWAELKQNVKDSIKRFETNEDVYRAIGYTIELINDGHSLFADPHTSNRLVIDTLSIPSVKTKIVGKHIGYLKLPGFLGNDSLSALYASEIRKALYELDHTTNLSGWIIDVRTHPGGKLTTESLGISPLFKDSLIGISCNNENMYTELTCTDNYFYFGDNKMDSLLIDDRLKNRNKKVAVLVDNKTASAGEFLALALKFQQGTKVFGTKTKGKTSHLRLITFVSNAKLLLTTEHYCDKNKKIIDGPIIPDIECSPEESLVKAIEWIE